MPIKENPVRLDMFQEIVNIGFPAIISSDGSVEPTISFYGMSIDILVYAGVTIPGLEEDQGVLVTAAQSLYLYTGTAYGSLDRNPNPVLGETFGGTVDTLGVASNYQKFHSLGQPDGVWEYRNGPTGAEEDFFEDLTIGINVYRRRIATPYDYAFVGRYDIDCSSFYHVDSLGPRYPHGFVLGQNNEYVMRMERTPLP